MTIIESMERSGIEIGTVKCMFVLKLRSNVK